MWQLCPTKHPDIVLTPPDVTVWEAFDPSQKIMWYIDEVEARWVRLRPTLDRWAIPTMSAKWATAEQFSALRTRVAEFIQVWESVPSSSY